MLQDLLENYKQILNMKISDKDFNYVSKMFLDLGQIEHLDQKIVFGKKNNLLICRNVNP